LAFRMRLLFRRYCDYGSVGFGVSDTVAAIRRTHAATTQRSTAITSTAFGVSDAAFVSAVLRLQLRYIFRFGLLWSTGSASGVAIYTQSLLGASVIPLGRVLPKFFWGPAPTKQIQSCLLEDPKVAKMV